MHQKRIKKEQDRLKKLEEIDRQRREKYVELKQKKRDRIQIKRDLERERSRMKKCDDERQVNTHFNAFFENDKTTGWICQILVFVYIEILCVGQKIVFLLGAQDPNSNRQKAEHGQ